MVSVTITALLMLGMSTFFAGTFRSAFDIQEKAESKQGQFMVNEILRDKFETLNSVVTENGSEAFLRNETDSGQMPFTYIGENNSHIVFKDLFIFNDMETVGPDMYFGDSGAGEIKKTDGTVAVGNLPVNFGGFAVDGAVFYVAIPDKNEVLSCDTSGGVPMSADGCDAMVLDGISLYHPTDVDINPINKNLYISDSGNDQVISYSEGISRAIATDLDFPTGLAFYDGPTHDFLFVSNTYDDQVFSIDLTDTKFTKTVVAGDGDNEACDNSARYCELAFPTGISVSDNALYVADTGNNRILKITDPETDLSDVKIDFNLDTATKISKVEVIFPEAPTLVSSSTTLHDDLGKKELVADTYSFSLSVPIVSGEAGSYDDACTDTDVDPVVPYFCRFIVPDSADIFNSAGGDEILLDSDSYSVLGVDLNPSDFGDSFDAVRVDEKPSLDPANANVTYPAGTEASINNDFPAGDYGFDFDLTGSSFDSFSNLHLDVYNEADTVVTSTDTILRIGDNVLGTEEDTVEVLLNSGLDFPTGLAVIGNNLYIADSLNAELKRTDIDTPVLSDLTAFSPYLTDFSSFDYTSDFETDSIEFNSYNSDTLLQLTVNAKVDATTTETYNLNATIPN